MPILKSGNLDCVILCGGQGSRLGSLTQRTPKPLLRFGEFPFLVWVLRSLKKQGFENFILAVHHLAEQFEDFAKSFEAEFPNLKCLRETTPLGTGGALRHAALQVSSETFVALNGDSLVTQPLAPVLNFHEAKKSPFTLVAVRKENVAVESHNKGGLEISAEGQLTRFRGHQAENEKWVNAGVYVTQRSTLLSWPGGFLNLENTLESLLEPARAFAFKSDQRLLDIGTPESLQRAQKYYETDPLLFGGRHP